MDLAWLYWVQGGLAQSMSKCPGCQVNSCARANSLTSARIVAALLGSQSTDTMSRTLLGYRVWMALSTEPAGSAEQYHHSQSPVAYVYCVFGFVLADVLCWLQGSHVGLPC